MTESLEKRFARHSQMANLVQGWVATNGLEILAAPGSRSQTVTAIRNTLGLDIDEVNSYLARQQMRIAAGYGQLKDKTFRIGHMGDTRIEDINTLLEALDDFIAVQH